MNNRTSDNQSVILSAIKKLGASLRNEIRKGDNSLRAEIRRGDKAIRQEVLKIEERVEEIEEKQEEMNGKLDSIESKLDGFVGNVGKLTEENVIATEHYRDHEKRIAKLEFTAQPA